MSHHDHVRARLHAAEEGLQILLQQFVQRFVHDRGLSVRVRLRAAVAGKVLQAADGVAVPEALHRGGDQLGRLVIIVAVRAVADDGIFRVAPHVGHRSKVHVEAAGLQIGRKRHRVVIRRLCAERAVAEHAVELRGADGVHQPPDLAALLVRADEQPRCACALQAGDELHRLLACFEVAGREQEPAHGIVLQRGGQLRRQLRDGRAVRSERLRTHDQKLADLLPRGHAVQQRLRAVSLPLLLRGLRRFRLPRNPAAHAAEHDQRHRKQRKCGVLSVPLSILFVCFQFSMFHSFILPRSG